MTDVSPVSMPCVLVGHDKVQNVFLDLYNKGRVPHAFLLTGPSGIGKSGLAFRMARILLSNESNVHTLDFDENDILAQKIQSLSHPDLRFLYEGYTSDSSENISGQIKTQDVRKAIEFTMMTPSDSHHRILILNDCHMITKSGQNTLLKTLEEPGKYTTILMTTDKTQSILPTIKSRCVKIAMEGVSEKQVMDILQRKYPDIPLEEITAYAHIANGSIGDAVSYVENNALQVYQSLLDSLYLGADSVYALSGIITGKKNTHLFHIMCKLWEYFSHKVVVAQGKSNPIYAILQSENDAYVKITNRYKGLELLDWTHRVTQSFMDTKSPVYLDRKLVLLTAFLPLHT